MLIILREYKMNKKKLEKDDSEIKETKDLEPKKVENLQKKNQLQVNLNL